MSILGSVAAVILFAGSYSPSGVATPRPQSPQGGQPKGECFNPTTSTGGPNNPIGCGLECGGVCSPDTAFNNFIPGGCEKVGGVCTYGATCELDIQYYACTATTIGCSGGQSKCYFTPNGAPIPTTVPGCPGC